MCSFYKRHEVLFSIILVVAYCAGASLITGVWSVLFLAAVSVLLPVCIVKGGHAKEFGFFWPENSRRYLYFIPLWIITTSPLWGGVVPECHGALLAVSLVLMLFVGYVEEVLFRGFLFRALLHKCGVVPAVIVSSLSFGFAHIVNLFAGQTMFTTIVQMLYSCAWGFIYAMVFYRSKSLLPCIISHALFDVFGYFNNEGQVLSWIVIGVIVAVSVVYGIYLARLPGVPATSVPAGKLYIMRHGTTDWNVRHKLQGRTDIPLNEDGRKLARKAHDEYAGVHFDVCFCSPLLRARETAALLLEGRNVPVRYDDRLMEMSFGEYEGVENSFDIPDCPVNPFFTDPAQYVAPGSAETMDSLFLRTGAFLEDAVRPLLASGRDVLIVGHGAMNNSIVCQVRRLPRSEFWSNGLEQCKLTELEETV